MASILTAPTQDDIEEHMIATYFSLRVGLTLVAVLLPPLLYVWGHSHNVSLQYSLSAYYHADATGLSCPGGHGVARDFFVGGLFAVAGLLYTYRGINALENWALNAAASFAAGVALFPMRIQCDGIPNRFSPHGTFAILFFLCIAVVAVFPARKTLERIHDPKERQFFSHGYRITALVMVLAPGTVIAWSLLTGRYAEHTFAIEVTGIYAFAAFWILKSVEIHQTNKQVTTTSPSISPTAASVRKRVAV